MSEVICRLDQLAERECREFEWSDGGEVVAAFLLRMGEGVVAYRNRCPHTGAPLNWYPDQFLTLEQEYIQCALHGALFRLEDGFCVHGPCSGDSLQSIELIEEAGVISIKHR
ncbi:MAG: Rieske 2Fe-2S domain-containing protein [Chromatiales bacterium]|nr:Rieske 2Fe-2S domain-containing protein [Chromatiales bacterium]